LLALHHATLRDPNFDYVRLLAELGHEQKFEVTYVDIEERLESGDLQCLVQLSTWPVAVCYGLGQDQGKANNDAARHGLNYLKLMTRKSANSTSATASKLNNSVAGNAGQTTTNGQ
jgi:RISC-loading complex subunit TARBP2